MSGLTAIYVGANVVYVRISKNTLHAMRNQAKESTRQFTEQITEVKKSADAALLSAQAIINTERARIVCDFSTSGLMGILAIRNCGRTPALLVDVKFHLRIRPPHDELPETPDYGLPTEFLHKRVLGAGDKWEHAQYRVRVSPFELTQATYDQVMHSQMRYWVYGRVEYRDVFKPDELHETAFCYFFSPPLQEFIIGGPSRYTYFT